MQSTWKRTEVIDPVLMGRKIVEWTLKPATRPTTFEDFQQQLAGALKITNSATTKFELIDTPDDTVTIRLPPAEMIRKALEKYTSPEMKVEDYPFPRYLRIDAAKLKEAKLTPVELFYSSVGDYTTSECE